MNIEVCYNIFLANLEGLMKMGRNIRDLALMILLYFLGVIIGAIVGNVYMGFGIALAIAYALGQSFPR